MYLPEKGEVLFGGVDAHTFDHRWYHKKIAIVGQEPVLFGRSIRRNILYGYLEEDEPSMNDIVEAAKLANATVAQMTSADLSTLIILLLSVNIDGKRTRMSLLNARNLSQKIAYQT